MKEEEEKEESVQRSIENNCQPIPPLRSTTFDQIPGRRIAIKETDKIWKEGQEEEYQNRVL
jgi:hypothetical protein